MAVRDAGAPCALPLLAGTPLLAGLPTRAAVARIGLQINTLPKIRTIRLPASAPSAGKPAVGQRIIAVVFTPIAVLIDSPTAAGLADTFMTARDGNPTAVRVTFADPTITPAAPTISRVLGIMGRQVGIEEAIGIGIAAAGPVAPGSGAVVPVGPATAPEQTDLVALLWVAGRGTVASSRTGIATPYTVLSSRQEIDTAPVAAGLPRWTRRRLRPCAARVHAALVLTGEAGTAFLSLAILGAFRWHDSPTLRQRLP